MKLDKLKEQVQKHPLFSLIIIVGGILAFFAGIISNITTIASFGQKNLVLSFILLAVLIIAVVVIIRSTPFFEKRGLLRKVVELKPGMNIGLYQEKFGTPIVTNYHAEKGLKEYIFINTYFYLDVVTDMNDVVRCFALTIKDKTFRPVFKSPGYPLNVPSFQLKLGVSTFGDIQHEPNYLRSWLGASYGFSYYETHYFGRSGNYQEFGFGVNCAGYQPNNLLGHLSVFSEAYDTTSYIDQVLSNLQAFRSEETFNTYAVSGSNTRIRECFDIFLGVDYNQVQAIENR